LSTKPLSDGAPRLQAAQEQLRKEKVTLELEKSLSHRPEREDLESRNILKGNNSTQPDFDAFSEAKLLFLNTLLWQKDQSIAPSLQAAQEALKKEKLAQALEHKLEARPEKDDLVNRNVLKGKHWSNY
jgi:hypothetical protein